MIQVIVSGFAGKMGNMLHSLITEQEGFALAAGVDRDASRLSGAVPVAQSFRELSVKGDVIIDFSHHDALSDVLEYASQKGIPAVIGTTGLNAQQRQQMEQAAQTVPLFYSANMSVGMNLLLELVKRSAEALGESCDIEIVETHHKGKKDAPSGTAFMLADSIKAGLSAPVDLTFGRHGASAERRAEEIGIHAVRGGTIVGKHSVLFAGDDESVELKHSAASRRIFGLGALRAAAFLVKQSAGLFGMADMLAAREISPTK